MNEWISVNDKLPGDAPVLVCFLEPSFGSFNKEFGVAYYDSPDNYEDPDDGQGWLFWLNDRPIVGGGVTHWMPLPEPPVDTVTG